MYSQYILPMDFVISVDWQLTGWLTKRKTEIKYKEKSLYFSLRKYTSISFSLEGRIYLKYIHVFCDSSSSLHFFVFSWYVWLKWEKLVVCKIGLSRVEWNGGNWRYLTFWLDEACIEGKSFPNYFKLTVIQI